MRIFSSVLFLAAHGQDMGDGYTAGEGKPIDDVLRRLKNLKKWGNECAGNLVPAAKNNILQKIYNFDRNAVQYYNNNNADFQDIPEPEHWFGPIDCSDPSGCTDRTISTDNPCECLWRVGRGYTNFYSRGFGDVGKPLDKANHKWSQMNKRLEKKYGCDFSMMGYNNSDKLSKCEKHQRDAQKQLNGPDALIDAIFVPTCMVNGDYTAEQCMPVGACWCSTPDGEEVPGSKTWPHLNGPPFICGLDNDLCSKDRPCADGWTCNYEFESSGYCKNCANYQTEEDCSNLINPQMFLSHKGSDECKRVCLEPTSIPLCDANHCSEDCVELFGRPCKDGWCNYENGSTGVCKGCAGIESDHDCIANDLLTNKAKGECLNVCGLKVCSPNHCTDGCPCSEGSWCNYEKHTHGSCKSCDSFATEYDCVATSLITNRGKDECKDVCVKPKVSCPAGWTKFDDEERCFKTKCQKTPISFLVAKKQCGKWSAELTKVKSEVQNGQVADSGPIGGLTDEGVQLKGGIWINGQDNNNEGSWHFMIGGPMTYFNWAQGQPNDGNPNIAQDCLWMNFLSKGEWDDMNCANERSVHCVSCSKDME